MANAELIGYFGHLSVSADPNINVDLDYLELILKRGADINTTDQYGQTVLHEVSGGVFLAFEGFFCSKDQEVSLKGVKNITEEPLISYEIWLISRK